MTKQEVKKSWKKLFVKGLKTSTMNIKNPHAVALGKQGGLAKAKKMTKKARKEMSKKLHEAKRLKNLTRVSNDSIHR